jgi:hypothetical protein
MSRKLVDDIISSLKGLFAPKNQKLIPVRVRAK